MATADAWERRIHARLLEDDPTAPSELAEAYLDRVAEKTQAGFDWLQDPDWVAEGAVDAVVEYIKTPKNYDPKRSSLLGFLTMASRRNVLNAIDKYRRRRKKEVLADLVELAPSAGNTGIAAVSAEVRLDAQEIARQLRSTFPDPQDQELAQLVIDGERATDAYADVLGISALPETEKRKQVKRHKDRIKKRLQRFGGGGDAR